MPDNRIRPFGVTIRLFTSDNNVVDVGYKEHAINAEMAADKAVKEALHDVPNVVVTETMQAVDLS